MAPAEGGGQGAARADLEFGVAARQVVFDGPLGDEQPLGDLAVGEPGGGQLRDAQFAGGERVPPVRGIAAWPAAGDDKLAAGPVTQGQTAHGVRQVQALPQQPARLGAGTRPALRRAEVDQRAGQFQRHWNPGYTARRQQGTRTSQGEHASTGHDPHGAKRTPGTGAN